MKALCKSLIFLGLFAILFSCKQEPKKVEDGKEITKAVIEKPEEVIQTKKQTIDDFLDELKTAIKNNNEAFISNSIKIPFEFKSGGESELYESTERLIKNPHFKKIIKAKFEKIEDDKTFAILYQQPKVEDFFIYYYAIEDGNSFKLKGMEMPH